jgi:hypothetical protein
MRWTTRLVVLLLVVAIIVLVAAPHLDLATALTRTHGRVIQFITFVIVSLTAVLPVPLRSRTFAFEREPLRRSAPILDLTCVLLC